MALKHVQPGEIVGVVATEDEDKRTRALFKAGGVEVLRVVMPAGKELPEHQAPGEVIVQCVAGVVDLTALGETQRMVAGQLLYLAPNEPHSVQCVEDCSLLVTIVLADSGRPMDSARHPLPQTQ